MGVKVLLAGHAGRIDSVFVRLRLERPSTRLARLSDLTPGGLLDASLRSRASAPAAVSA
jgi:hypothetical protein